MPKSPHNVSLGFTGQTFEPGVHICQIYSDKEERQETLLKFLLQGIRDQEQTLCLSDSLREEIVDEFLDNYGISYSEAKGSGDLLMYDVRDVYFEGNEFDPERILDKLKLLHNEAMDHGYEAARVIGEMLPEVHSYPGGSRLMEYEARVSMLLRAYPITTVCQYDSRQFDGATIMDVLKVHPLMIIRGSVVHNPFYILPEEFLRMKGCQA